MSNVSLLNLKDGIPFTVRLVYTGQKYGHDFKLVNEGPTLVEFYDARYDFDLFGQFITRYHAKTLIEGYDDESNCGLNLQGDIEAWHLSNLGYAEVIDWLEEVLEKVTE